MAYNLHAVTSTILIPLSEPEQGNNLILSEPALDQLVCVSYSIFDIWKHFQRLCIHHCVLPPVPIVSHPPQYFPASSKELFIPVILYGRRDPSTKLDVQDFTFSNITLLAPDLASSSSTTLFRMPTI